MDIESGDEGIDDFGFGSESDEEATAVLPEKPTLSLSCLMNRCSESPRSATESMNLARSATVANLCNDECNRSPSLRASVHEDAFEKNSIMIDSCASVVFARFCYRRQNAKTNKVTT